MSDYISTIGADFAIKTLQINGGNTKIKLQIWDTSGQERFQTITKAYYRGANVIIFVYDITNRESFEKLREQFVDDVRQYTDASIPIVIFGNKTDMAHSRATTFEEAKNFALEIGVLYHEISSKENINVDIAFLETA